MRKITLSIATALVVGWTAAIPARAELNESIDLTLSHNLTIQRQSDLRWGLFQVGPSGGGPEVNMARCGCFLTSLSTGLGAVVGGEFAGTGSRPWFPTYLFDPRAPGFFSQTYTLNPAYVQAYLAVHPIDRSAPRDWGFVGSGSSTNCGVQLKPSASDFIASPALVGGVAITSTGLTWDVIGWNYTGKNDVDAGLKQGWPSIVTRTAGNGFHANLIVGWDNIKKRYLIYDPMWKTDFFAGGGVNYMGYTFEGATEDEKYSNYQAAIVNVKPMRPVYAHVPPSRWLTIFDDPEPIELRLIDPRGRRTGHDPVTNGNIQENKESFYSEFTSWADPLGEFPEAAPVRYIASRDPEPGVYGLEVFGTGDGPFVLTVGTIDGDRQQNSATITGNITTGEIKRYEITYSGGSSVTVAAVAAFGPRAQAGNDVSEYVGNTVNFDGRGSHQISGAITAHSWNFGDGTSAAGAQATHIYTAPGTFTATLTVTNAAGLTASDDRTILVIDPAALPQSETIRVNVTSAGAQALGGSSADMEITSNGRYVAFQSYAANLVAGDTNNRPDIFVKDLATGLIARVSVGTGGVEATGLGNGSDTPSISADSRFVAFYSDMDNLAAGSISFLKSLYLHDRASGVTELIAANTASGQNKTSLSGDGRYLAYATGAGFTVRDRQVGIDQLFTGRNGRISEDGQFIAFVGFNGVNNVVSVYNRQTGVTELVSRTPSGVPIQGANSFNPAISGDGRYVAFDVDQGGQVVPGTYNIFGLQDVFVRDRLLGTTERMSVSSTGDGSNFGGGSPSISADGRYVSFYSSADNLAPNGVFQSLQVYRRDRQAGTTERFSVSNTFTAASPGIFAAGGMYNLWPAFVASDGSVVFYATATNLVAGDTNGALDIFIRRLVSGTGGGSTTPLANLGGPYLGWASGVAVPAAIRLDGSGSVDPNGAALTGHWDFGDGSPPENGSLVINHAYAEPGVYQVTLTVDSGGDTSTAARTEVEVLPPLPADGISVGACSAKGGTIPFNGAASVANAALIANGWDTSTGPIQMAPVSVGFPWGQVQVPTTLPALTFEGSAVVPIGTGDGIYAAAVSGGPSAPFNIPCATQANLPPLAVAGGPIYMSAAGTPVTLNGTASSDPENAPLSYRWDFGDGTSGTGSAPAHTYQNEGSYFVTLIVNDGTQDSAVMIGTRSFAMVMVGAGTQQFPFEGFFAPVDNLPVVNLVQAGSAIPLKFSLGGDRGLDIFAAGYPKSQIMPCNSTAPLDGIEQTVTAGASSLTYDAASGRYHYVWKTEKSWARTCRQLVLKLTDGTSHSANFKFK